jgi:hypothetical protein
VVAIGENRCGGATFDVPSECVSLHARMNALYK